MKKLLYISILLCCLSSNLLAADDNAAEMKIESKKTFVLQAQEGGPITIDLILEVTGTKEANKLINPTNFKLSFLDTSIVTTSIVNIETLYIKISEILRSKEKLASDDYLNSNDVIGIYFWLNSFIHDGEERPKAGKIDLHAVVRIYDNRNDIFQPITDQQKMYPFKLAELKYRIKKVQMIIDTIHKTYPNTIGFKAKNSNITKPAYLQALKDFEIVTKNQTELNLCDSIIKEFEKIAKRNTTQKKQLDSLNNKKNSLNLVISRFNLNTIQKNIQEYPIQEATKIKKKLTNQIEIINIDMKNQHLYEIKNLQIQFERGFLEKIQATVHIPDEGNIMFENFYAIGFSSRRNFADMSLVSLYERKSRSNRYIYLSGVIANYTNFFDNFTRDFCPADSSMNEIDPSVTQQLQVYRSRLVDLLDVKIYMDLVGLATNSPNGLVQTELQKRFNLYTSRKKFKGGINYCFFNHINLVGSLTKIEEKNKYLPLQNQKEFTNGTLTSPSYASTLDFIRYESMSFAVEPNVLLFDFPDAKFTLTADLGLKYGQTPLIDSTYSPSGEEALKKEVKPAGLLTMYPRLKAEVFAEKRYGFSVAYQLINTRLLSNNAYKQVHSYQKGDLTSSYTYPNARWSSMIELYARYEPKLNQHNGKIFFRGRIFTQHKDINTYFAQIQLGYAFFLTYNQK
ncbi:MAG: hypothetical protein KA198_00595 [Chitinophagaceae bacterium]|nr:hypothetical protein [Chitinophagaceae bacterium]